jgi:hypothetical protein
MNRVTTKELQLCLDSKSGTDFPTFIHRTFQTIARGQPDLHNWHIDAIAWALNQCLRGEWTRLATMLPPRHLKSIWLRSLFPPGFSGTIPRVISFARVIPILWRPNTRSIAAH